MELEDLVKIHVGDQADAKILLGTYICTDVPGEFRWQPGVLTQAVCEGIAIALVVFVVIIFVVVVVVGNGCCY